MIARLWSRVCPHCLHDDGPVGEHPALLIMQRSEGRLDRMLAALAKYEPDARESGNTLRDLAAGARRDEGDADA